MDSTFDNPNFYKRLSSQFLEIDSVCPSIICAAFNGVFTNNDYVFAIKIRRKIICIEVFFSTLAQLYDKYKEITEYDWRY